MRCLEDGEFLTMQHTIDAEKFGPLGKPIADAIKACVHCGFCLPACPTYREFGQEMDSPRGRIVLVKQVLEGTLPWAEVQPHIDRCLGCLACEPACPSGVAYGDLISPFRVLAEAKVKRPLGVKVRRWLAGQTIPFPWRFRLALLGAKLGKMFSGLVPAVFRPMLELAPSSIPAGVKLARVHSAKGERRGRVALLAGCAQQVLDPDINQATIEVLTRNGVEVIVPDTQGCCGGLAWHTGDLRAAQAFARKNLQAFSGDVDAILTNAAGCGSAMHEYHLILKGTPDEGRARAFRDRVMDVSVYLVRLGLRETPEGWSDGKGLRVAYHDACHLANAQGVRNEPRALLRAVPGLEVRELTDPHICCGSAGTYNLDQPETAASLGAKKASAVLATGAEVVASGNIGCLTQLRAHLEKTGASVRVRHTMQILRDAYGEK